MKYYTFYPEDVESANKEFNSELDTDIWTDESSIPESSLYLQSDFVKSLSLLMEYNWRIMDNPYAFNPRTYSPKKAFSKCWKATTVNDFEDIETIIFDGEIFVRNAEGPESLYPRKKPQNIADSWYEVENRFNPTFMLQMFIGAYLPCEKEWEDNRQLLKNACEEYVAKGGNLDFIKLKLTKMRNQLTLQKQRIDKILNNLGAEQIEKVLNTDPYVEFRADIHPEENKTPEYTKLVKQSKTMEENITKLDIVLNELETLQSPYDKTLEEIRKNPELSIREAISQYDKPMLKNVLFCKHQLFLEKRRTLAIEQGIEYDLIPNSPEIILMTKVLEEIKAMEKENKTESE